MKRNGFGREIPERDRKIALDKETGLVGEVSAMKRKTNFDRYLEEQLQDQDFVESFNKAVEAWDAALELSPEPDKEPPLQNRH
jgi:hypothetical protein